MHLLSAINFLIYNINIFHKKQQNYKKGGALIGKASERWIVDNLNSALKTWNDKQCEIWQLLI